MSAIDQLLELTAEYRRASGIDTKTLSWRVFGDSKKLGAIVDGADIQTKRLERAVQWLSSNWPEGATWPKGVNRPLTPIEAGRAA
ncbi:MAG: hypothetical protein Q8N10_03445 [Phenylobacterium sp.]|uniref:hypothetical protein n=1 Tax=Phenylobacterium sp. TaxID=1871053 RepID=UPI0027169861|nr:hypothetical protein [Phenylobacterium sp.]MDO8912325.1 hypothetical protein [Phenylobacterium sp.]MDP3099537.1 hypothetical protein [Phenylobacterium sp.]